MTFCSARPRLTGNGLLILILGSIFFRSKLTVSWEDVEGDDDTEGDSVSIVVNSSIFVLKTLFFSFFQFIIAGINNGIFRCISLVNKPYLDCFAVNMYLSDTFMYIYINIIYVFLASIC